MTSIADYALSGEGRAPAWFSLQEGDSTRCCAEAGPRSWTPEGTTRSKAFTGTVHSNHLDTGVLLLPIVDLLAGRSTRGTKEILETVTGYAADVGLLCEEIDVRDGELIDTFRQALSHIVLINAAWAIAHAQKERGHEA